MAGEFGDESLLDMFIFETTQNVAQLEQLILDNEGSNGFSAHLVDEIFRIMHTIKGSAAMMEISNLSKLAHSAEDLFSFIRGKPEGEAFDTSAVTDLVLESIDFIKTELARIQDGQPGGADETILHGKLLAQLEKMKGGAQTPAQQAAQAPAENEPQQAQPDAAVYKNAFNAHFFFEDGCQMESIRAFDVIYKLRAIAGNITCIPEDIMDSDDSVALIRENGVELAFETDRDEAQVFAFLSKMAFVTRLTLEARDPNTAVPQAAPKAQDAPEKTAPDAESKAAPPTESRQPEVRRSNPPPAQNETKQPEKAASHTTGSSIISVNVAKLDKLMDLIGELVISEAMVIHNPDLKGLELDGFQKAAQRLRKITSEMQDMVMSIRMVPLTTTFQKMNRIVRDMCKKLDKEVELKIIGDETEVDKNIIEHISDPLMHLVRNSLDHGIESAADRKAAGKSEMGTITLEAKNEGSEVLVSVRDDGRGLNKEKILARAKENGLLTKPVSEMSDREIYSLVFLPGFSTKEKITEFSGRGVGMDVVVKNIEMVGGRVIVDSVPGKGCVNTMKFPITLAIIEGMNIRVGSSRYTIPITDIKQSFRPRAEDIITDPDAHEMIMVRGRAYPVIRLHDLFSVEPDSRDLCSGIIIMAESGERSFCVFVDELLGQQEVVVKALPAYVKKSRGLAGCTLLGDGQISLILDTGSLDGLKSAHDD